MKKSIWIFLLAVLAPGVVLGWLALRSAEEQQIVFERRTAELYQKETENLAEEIRKLVDGERRAFGDVVRRLLANGDAEALARDFTNTLADAWPRQAIGFALSGDGQMLSPSAKVAAGNEQWRKFLWENSSFLCSTKPAVVYPLQTTRWSATGLPQSPFRAKGYENEMNTNPALAFSTPGQEQEAVIAQKLAGASGAKGVVVLEQNQQQEKAVERQKAAENVESGTATGFAVAAPAPVDARPLAEMADAPAPPPAPASPPVAMPRKQGNSADVPDLAAVEDPLPLAPAMPAEPGKFTKLKSEPAAVRSPQPKPSAAAPKPAENMPEDAAAAAEPKTRAVSAGEMPDGSGRNDADKDATRELKKASPALLAVDATKENTVVRLQSGQEPAADPGANPPRGHYGMGRQQQSQTFSENGGLGGKREIEALQMAGQPEISGGLTAGRRAEEVEFGARLGGVDGGQQPPDPAKDELGKSLSAGAGDGAKLDRLVSGGEAAGRDNNEADFSLVRRGQAATTAADAMGRFFGSTPAPGRADGPANRLVEPQQQVRAPAANWSSVVPETADFSMLTAWSDEGMVSRFVQDNLELIFWIRPPEAPEMIFGCLLDASDLGDLWAKLMGSERPNGGNGDAPAFVLALLDDRARPVAMRPAGGAARDWKRPFVASEIGEMLPHWEAALYLATPTAIIDTARGFRRTLSFTIAGALALIAIGGWLVVADVRRQLALAQQKTDFVSNVSHELKTPLTSIRMFAELLHDRPPPVEKQGQYLRIITVEAERLTRLINNVLDFAKLERRQRRFEKKPLDLHAVIARVWEGHEMHLRDAGFTTKWEGAPGPYPVVGDEDALAQVLVNLLSNAEKYSPETKDVELVTWIEDGSVNISVLDRGLGVEEGEERKIFEAFYRAHDSLSSGIQGSGLGLTLAARLAAEHGGEVRFERRKGGGSRFTLRVPLAVEKERNEA